MARGRRSNKWYYDRYPECHEDMDCIKEAVQWEKDHPNGEISEEEQRSMDRYAYESSYYNKYGVFPDDERAISGICSTPEVQDAD